MKGFSTGDRITGRYTISLCTKKDQGSLIVTELLRNGSVKKTEIRIGEFYQFEPAKLIFISMLSRKTTVIFDQTKYDGINESIRNIRKEAIENFLSDSLGILPSKIEEIDDKFRKICQNEFLELSDSEIDKFIEGTLGAKTTLGAFEPKEVPKTRDLVSMKTVKSWNKSPLARAESLKRKAKEN